VIGLVALFVIVVAVSSTAARGGDTVTFRVAADRICTDTDAALAKLPGRDLAGQDGLLEREITRLRALPRPSADVVAIGRFVVARGAERSQTRRAHRLARRPIRGRRVVRAVVVSGDSSHLAAELGLKACATRGVPTAGPVAKR
jgi:hypothetical protein